MLQIKTQSAVHLKTSFRSQLAFSLITHNKYIAALAQPIQRGPVAPQMFHPKNNLM